MPSCWVAPGFPGCFLSTIGPALPFWVGQKIVGVFPSLQALNPHKSLQWPPISFFPFVLNYSSGIQPLSCPPASFETYLDSL